MKKYNSVVLFSAVLSLFIFFQEKNLQLYFDSDHLSAYFNFSVNVFGINTSYFAESLLLPLLSNLIGASSSPQGYKLFSAFVTVSIIPLLAMAANNRYQNAWKSFIFILVVAVTFPYFQINTVGMPDPLTILFGMLAAVSSTPVAVFWFTFGASLSHFSEVIFIASGLVFFYLQASELTLNQRRRLIKFLLFGVLAGKLFLVSWNIIFAYELGTRLDWIRERGPGFFIERYRADVWGFWLTPKWYFLTSYFAIATYFAIGKRWAMIASMFIALTLAYVATFVTIDGFRVFAVTISGAYAFAIAELIDSTEKRLEQLRKIIYRMIYKISGYFSREYFYIINGLILSCGWFFILRQASEQGLLINSSLISEQAGLSHVALFTICLIAFIIICFETFRSFKLTSELAKLIFLLPIFIISFQYLRRIFYFNVALPTSWKIFFCILMVVSIYFARRWEISPIFEKYRIRCILLFS